MRRHILKNKSGFTFIELLIGLMIMAILFTVGFASYRQFSSRQNIEGIVREIKGDLRLAQQMATSGVKSTDAGSTCSDPNNELRGYIVRRLTTTSYEISANCGGNVNLIKEVNLVEKYPNMTITEFNFIFQPVAGGIGWSGSNYITVSEIIDGATVATRTISVTQAGQIN